MQRGEVFGFLGPNGAGKTTTIRMMMGILVPSGGRALINGLDCHTQRAEVQRHVGYLPDNPIYYDFLRGREILQFVAEMHGMERARGRAAGAAHARRSSGSTEVVDEFAVNYSMGMKKKLGLACALIHDPQVLILDEPINGLDPRAARDVQDRLRQAAASGKTIFMSTHLLDMAEKVCTRVGIIHRGELVATGTLAELRERVEPERVARGSVPQGHRGRARAPCTGSVNRTGAAPLLRSTCAADPAATAPAGQPDHRRHAAQEEARRQGAHRQSRQEEQQGHPLPGAGR